MAEPTTRLTFGELILEVAELIGINEYDGSGVPVVPTDAYNLNLCKQIVNNGIRMFISDAPNQGWRWQHRMQTVTFSADGTGPNNIDNDPGRYLLSDDYGAIVDGAITYESETGTYRTIQWVDESVVRRYRETDIPISYPAFASTRPYGERQYEFFVYPNPESDYTVVFPYTANFDSMTDVSDLHPAGFQFDETVLAACKARAEMRVNDRGSEWVGYYRNMALPHAYALDSKIKAVRLGKLRSGRSGIENRRSRLWKQVEYL